MRQRVADEWKPKLKMQHRPQSQAKKLNAPCTMALYKFREFLMSFTKNTKCDSQHLPSIPHRTSTEIWCWQLNGIRSGTRTFRVSHHFICIGNCIKISLHFQWAARQTFVFKALHSIFIFLWMWVWVHAPLLRLHHSYLSLLTFIKCRS